MPQKINRKRATQRSRNRTKPGAHKAPERCRPGVRCSEEGPAIIANSFFALTLPKLKGYQTVQEEFCAFQEPVSRINTDLLGSLNRALKLLHNIPPIKVDKLKHTDAFELIINVFESRVLPAGFKYNIERDESQNYMFTVYKAIHFEDYWHFFPIKKIVDHLEKKDNNLLQLFLCTINALRSIADFNAWFDNLYAADMIIHDEDGANDYLLRMDDLYDNEEEGIAAGNEFMSDVEAYKTGRVKQYQEAIHSSNYDINKIAAGVKKYRSNNKIASWIKQALDLLQDGQCLNNFKYSGLADEDYGDGCVRLEDQVTILWSETDSVFKITAEYMDNEAANFGVEQPFLNFPISKTNRFIPFNTIPVAEKWMGKISTLFRSFHAINDKLK